MFPFFYQQAPLLLTPGFAINNVSTPGGGGLNAALPPRIYDAYLDTAWKPQITNFLSADLGVRVGDGETAATVRVPDIAGLAALLALLAQARAGHRG